MKTNWPEPFNPENVSLTPGYRFIGRAEDVNWETDETPRFGGRDTGRWDRINDPLIKDYVMKRRDIWTIRRPLNVDDPYAPPPEEWAREGWEIFTFSGFVAAEALSGWQHWSLAPQGGPRWIDCPTGTIWSNSFYYRRPIASSTQSPMNPTTPPSPEGLIVNWISLKDRYPTDAEAKAGLWTFYRSDYSDNGYVQSAKWHDAAGFKKCSTGITHFAPIVWPQPPKNLLPAVPVVNGYEMQYAKNTTPPIERTVKFGCAEISVSMLYFAKTLMTTKRPGNRTVQSITLSSAVSITRQEVEAILDYVEAVNKG